MKISPFFFSIVAILISGCEKKPIEVYPNPGQLFLFQVEHTNNAWGYSHDGILIDSSGNIGYFRYPSKWNSIDSTGYITESELIENMNHLDSVFTIDKNQVFKNFDLVKYAVDGEITEPEHGAYDMGETIYSGFILDPQSRKYKQVLIQEFGDWSRFNKSPAANQIFTWLRSTYIEALNKAKEK